LFDWNWNKKRRTEITFEPKKGEKEKEQKGCLFGYVCGERNDKKRRNSAVVVVVL
jgi:hypothetical protein